MTEEAKPSLDEIMTALVKAVYKQAGEDVAAGMSYAIMNYGSELQSVVSRSFVAGVEWARKRDNKEPADLPLHGLQDDEFMAPEDGE